MSNSSNANANQGYGQRAVQTYQGMGGFAKVVIIILIVLILGYLVYWGVTSRSGSMFSSRLNPVIISDPINAFDNGLGTRGIDLPLTNQGLEFTYSFWIYVQDWSFNFGNKKFIFVKGNPNNGIGDWSPAIWLGERENTLYTSISVFSMQGTPSTPGLSTPYQQCAVKDIPLQKWVYIAYVLNNRNVDVYIDGKLEKSCMLGSVPQLNNKPLYITPGISNTGTSEDATKRGGQETGFYGQISSFQYFTQALTPSVISEIYMNGPYSHM